MLKQLPCVKTDKQFYAILNMSVLCRSVAFISKIILKGYTKLMFINKWNQLRNNVQSIWWFFFSETLSNVATAEWKTEWQLEQKGNIGRYCKWPLFSQVDISDDTGTCSNISNGATWIAALQWRFHEFSGLFTTVDKTYFFRITDFCDISPCSLV